MINYVNRAIYFIDHVHKYTKFNKNNQIVTLQHANYCLLDYI